jgi:hypothetical protein
VRIWILAQKNKRAVLKKPSASRFAQSAVGYLVASPPLWYVEIPAAAQFFSFRLCGGRFDCSVFFCLHFTP